LNRAIEVAFRVAPTDLSVLISGESGAGKEVFPQIIHRFSARKHGPYIAVNCGAIPEGTIDSELFGHQKGSLPELMKTVAVILKKRIMALFSWMRFQNYLCPLR
jgi:DNA-binding NtrC family response regulator